MRTNNYIPQPIDTTAVVLPKELMNLAEEMAKNVHEVWAAGRIADGWTYGAGRGDPRTVPGIDVQGGHRAASSAIEPSDGYHQG